MSFPMPDDNGTPTRRDPTRTATSGSTTSSVVRAASIKLMESRPPPGMWAATANSASKAPSLADIRRGSFGSEGWNTESQRQRAGSKSSIGEERRGMSPRMMSSSLTTSPSEGPEGGSAPNPGLFAQVIQERTSYEATEPMLQYDGQGGDITSAVEPKQRSTTTKKSEEDMLQQPLRHSGEVSLLFFLCVCKIVTATTRCYTRVFS